MRSKSNGLAGYTLATFFIIFGFFWFMFGGRGWVWIGFPFLIFGFLGLLVELSEEGYKRYCYFTGGVALLILSLYFIDYEFFLLKFIFAVLICSALTCFIIGALYSYRISKSGITFAGMLFNIFELAGSIYSIYLFLKGIVGYWGD